jgi:hypothetical protein
MISLSQPLADPQGLREAAEPATLKPSQQSKKVSFRFERRSLKKGFGGGDAAITTDNLR